MLRNFFPFNQLSDSTRSLVEGSLVRRTFEKNERVIAKGDEKDRSVYLVLSGVFETVPDQSNPKIRGSTQMGHGSFFGERASLFDCPRTIEVRCSAESNGSAFVMPGDMMLAILDAHETRFALSLSSKLRFDQRLFDNFWSFRSLVTSTINKSGRVSLEPLEAGYRSLFPAIHTKLLSNEVDYAAWSYAIQRLPTNITSTFCLVLSRKLLGLLDTTILEDGSSTIGDHYPGTNVTIPERRRTVRELMPGKTFILLREVFSDFLDVVTNLALHSVESKKCRDICKPLAISVPVFQAGAKQLKHVTDPAECKEIERKILSERLDSSDVAGLQSLWAPGKVLTNLVNICVHHGDYDLRLDPGSNFYGASTDEAWINRLRQAVTRVIGPFHSGDPSLVVDIISSNTHSVVNCLSPYVHKNSKTILKWAKSNRKHLFKDDLLSDSDRLYPALVEYLKEFPDEKSVKETLEEGAGIFGFPEKEMTGVSTQIVNLNMLQRYDSNWDSVLEGMVTEPERRGAALSKTRHLLINMDYCFGSQAEHLMRLLCLTFGRNISSISVMGKGGGLTGSRGDILFPTHLLDEGTHGTMRPVDNRDVDLAKLNKLSGRCVHAGPVVTIEGTLLQNRELLKYYERLWHATGLEMEGTYYLRAIEESRMLGLLRHDIRSRFLYYVSDLPLDAGKSSLATKMTLGEGVPPLYSITRTYLSLILSRFAEIVRVPQPLDENAVDDVPIVSRTNTGSFSGKTDVVAGLKHWRKTKNVFRAVVKGDSNTEASGTGNASAQVPKKSRRKSKA